VDEWISPKRNQIVIVDDFVLDLEKNAESANWITEAGELPHGWEEIESDDGHIKGFSGFKKI
jgi:hypothetical protein